MTKHITLIRHAESTGNRSGLWQGHTDAPLSENGRDQVDRLSKRLAGRQYRRIVSSDLARTRKTAESVGSPETDTAWRELDLGEWEGLTFEEIRHRDPDVLAAIGAGGDFVIPGGEPGADFVARLNAAFEDLVASLDDEDHAAVFSHGGAIQTLVASLLGMRRAFAPIRVPKNTALTSIRVDGDHRQVFAYNDGAHVGESVDVTRMSTTDVYLFRHGQTEGNVARRWQGRGDSALTEAGRHQVRQLAGTAPSMDRLFASPLGRTRETASVIADGHGHAVQFHDDLVEMDFGDWEDMTAAEAEEQHPEQFDLIYHQGVDLPRGVNGESFAQAGERLAGAVSSIVEQHAGERIGMVTHGGAARAFVAHLLGIGFGDRDSIPVLRNTAWARIVYSERGPLLSEYNVAPHFED